MLLLRRAESCLTAASDARTILLATIFFLGDFPSRRGTISYEGWPNAPADTLHHGLHREPLRPGFRTRGRNSTLS